MALTPNSQYVFTDLTEQRVFVQSTDLLDRGTWTVSLFYSRYNVVAYLGALYVCVSDNIGVPPDGTLSDEWSLLVVVSGTAGTEASAQAAYDLALAAYSIAVVGTNAANAALAAAMSAQGSAATALVFATSALAGVDTVLDLAVTGTNVADEALSIAISGTNTANTAFSIAVIGTNAAAQAEHDALVALQTAWSGTAGANQAFALAVIGTNASGNSALAVTALHTAWSGTAGANQAFGLAVQGTNAAAQAEHDALVALQTAWSGTAGANQAFALAVAGTNLAGNSAVAVTALQTAWSGTAGVQQAFALAAIGTNVGTNAYTLAQQAYNLALAGTTGGALQLAQAAFDIAVQGTNALLVEVAARIFGDGTTLSAANAYTDSKVSGGSNYAFNLFVTGTNYTNSQTAIAVITAQSYTDAQIAVERAARVFGDGTVAQNGSQYSFGLWVSGTNYTDSQIQNAIIGAGSSSLALYWAGTTYTNAAVAAEAAARASAITVEAGARIAGDAANAANISVNSAAIVALQNILGISVNGTVSYYMAQALRGKPDTKVTLVNGVLTGIVQSPFVWDDFTSYSAGPATNLNKGSSWLTPQQGSITTNTFTGTVAQDPFQSYAAGTLQVETDLYGFATNGTFAKPYLNYLGVDSFEQYSVGTIWNPQISAGTEFISPAVLFAL